MKELKEKIAKEGVILPGSVLRVDSFLNQQIDVELLSKCADKWYETFKDLGITKVLTIESAGIAIAALTALRFGVDAVYAKKTRNSMIGDDYYSTKVVSYTHGQVYDVIVSKKFISPDDRVLIVDDFLANGSALKVLIGLTEMGGATVVGAGVVIEKTYQNGGKDIRELGYRVESLAKIRSMDISEGIVFED